MDPFFCWYWFYLKFYTLWIPTQTALWLYDPCQVSRYLTVKGREKKSTILPPDHFTVCYLYICFLIHAVMVENHWFLKAPLRFTKIVSFNWRLEQMTASMVVIHMFTTAPDGLNLQLSFVFGMQQVIQQPLCTLATACQARAFTYLLTNRKLKVRIMWRQMEHKCPPNTTET